MNDIVVSDYWNALSIARKWARIALENKREGLPWKNAAKQSHEALRYALMIIQ